MIPSPVKLEVHWHWHVTVKFRVPRAADSRPSQRVRVAYADSIISGSNLSERNSSGSTGTVEPDSEGRSPVAPGPPPPPPPNWNTGTGTVTVTARVPDPAQVGFRAGPGNH
jgi:hypothetical protein